MSIKEDLKNFYDNQAKKYYETRKKFRSEGDLILEEIKKYEQKNISILEFGCGSARLISFLNENLKDKKIDYIGVDISKNLIKYAQKDNPKNKFICDDITNYIKKTKQESFDFIIGIASFQHIPTSKEKIFLMKNFYRSLKYNGKLIMINRSMSNWFINKYFKNILNSILKFIISFGKEDRRNILVPRKTNKNQIINRFYHIFGLKELNNISTISGFVINKLGYIEKDNIISNNPSKSQNSILIAEKVIFIK